jgi:hypothetical protein
VIAIMAVYVDELRPLTDGIVWGGRRQNHPEACRLWADHSEDLEILARKLGLRRDWKRGDHYLLTRSMRDEALRLGATFASSRKFVRMRSRYNVRVSEHCAQTAH